MTISSRSYRSIISVLLGGLLLAGLPACTSSQGATSSSPITTPSGYTINVLDSLSLGQHLVDGMGFSLYWTTADGPDTSNVPEALLGIWPVFYTASVSVPQVLKVSDFGSIKRSDGKMVTTYKSWPLYYYAGDNYSGQINGQGLGGRWSVVNPAALQPEYSTPPHSTTTPPPPTTTTPPATTTTTPPATTTPPSTSTSTATFQTLASSGQKTFSNICATCHGDNGQGTQICPVVMWGSGSTLGTYNGSTLFTDANGMLNYISSKMPLTSPGSLTHQQYTELLAYILLQDNLASPSTAFNENQLSGIAIK